MSSSAPSLSSESILGQSALSQILANQKKRVGEREKRELARKLETSPVAKGKGLVSVDDVYSLLKLQNGIDCSKVELRKLFNELDLDRESRVSIHVSALYPD
jgi:Ca2+-binding EF-hand superfamily protein